MNKNTSVLCIASEHPREEYTAAGAHATIDCFSDPAGWLSSLDPARRRSSDDNADGPVQVLDANGTLNGVMSRVEIAVAALASGAGGKGGCRVAVVFDSASALLLRASVPQVAGALRRASNAVKVCS